MTKSIENQPDSPSSNIDFLMATAEPITREMTLPVPPADVGRKWVVLATVALVMLPLLYFSGRREIARWHQAAALEHLYDRKYADALIDLERGLTWDPDNLTILSEEAQLYLNMSDAASAANVADRALEIARARNESRTLSGRDSRLIHALNASAYSHALDESDLEASLEKVNEALELAEGLESAGILDTRGYLHYLLGNDEQALDDTEQAVGLLDSDYRLLRAHYLNESRPFVDRRPFDYRVRQLDESLAVLLHHRGLVYERVGRTEEAERDLTRAKKLGYDPAQGVW